MYVQVFIMGLFFGVVMSKQLNIDWNTYYFIVNGSLFITLYNNDQFLKCCYNGILYGILYNIILYGILSMNFISK